MRSNTFIKPWSLDVAPPCRVLPGLCNSDLIGAADLLANMETEDLVTFAEGGLHLTAGGRIAALHIIRAHRLWEQHLAEETGVGELQWHEQAERQEHLLSPAEADALAARLGHPTHDPHGDPIPEVDGELLRENDQPLTSLEVDRPACIVHLEDEPETIFAQLVAQKLHPGMHVRVLERTPQRIRFWADGDEHVLAPILAENISVMPLSQEEPAEEDVGEPLSMLKPGERGQVISITRSLRGVERRRLVDLGILPGTIVTVEMTSPSGDPTAYRIREAAIALRREQASLIRVNRLPKLAV